MTTRYSVSSGSIPFNQTQIDVTKSMHTFPFAFFPPLLFFLLSLGKCIQSYFRGTLNYNTKNITTLESPRTADIKVLRAESIFSVGWFREGKPSVGNIAVGWWGAFVWGSLSSSSTTNKEQAAIQQLTLLSSVYFASHIIHKIWDCQYSLLCYLRNKLQTLNLDKKVL